MSTTSRLRNTKQPTSNCRNNRVPGANKHLIPQKVVGLFRATYIKTTGAFGRRGFAQKAKAEGRA